MDSSKVVKLHRLTPEAYRELEKQCTPPCTPKDGYAAAYALGQQQVLMLLRRGFVVGDL